jgi:serine/threonine protein kinase
VRSGNSSTELKTPWFSCRRSDKKGKQCDMPDQQENRLGQQVSEYRLVRKLSGGSFGAVYLAEHVYHHTQVSVKVLDIRQASSEDFKDCLLAIS